jgi:hypothetical protein
MGYGVDLAHQRRRRSYRKTQPQTVTVRKPWALSQARAAKTLGAEHARYVPERRRHRGQSRCLTVSVSTDPQVSQSAGDSDTLRRHRLPKLIM